jgi:hypothetical protein
MRGDGGILGLKAKSPGVNAGAGKPYSIIIYEGSGDGNPDLRPRWNFVASRPLGADEPHGFPDISDGNVFALPESLCYLRASPT